MQYHYLGVLKYEKTFGIVIFVIKLFNDEIRKKRQTWFANKFNITQIKIIKNHTFAGNKQHQTNKLNSNLGNKYIVYWLTASPPPRPPHEALESYWYSLWYNTCREVYKEGRFYSNCTCPQCSLSYRHIWPVQLQHEEREEQDSAQEHRLLCPAANHFDQWQEGLGSWSHKTCRAWQCSSLLWYEAVMQDE